MNSQVQRPQLDQYTGQTAVQMSPETQNMLSQILALSQSPGFQQMLSGKTDQGLFQSGVVNPMQREFRNTTLPGIQDAFSGGAYGGGYWSGARQKASMEGQNKLNEQISGLRYQDYNNAQQRAIQAAGLLPQFSQALSLKEQLAGQNLDRGIDVHYKNQGLKDTQYKEDMDFVNSILGAQNNLNSQMLTARGQDISQASDLRGNAISQQQLDNNLRLGLMGDATSRSNAGMAAMTSQSNAAMAAATAETAAQREMNLIREMEARRASQGINANSGGVKGAQSSTYTSPLSGTIKGQTPTYNYQTTPYEPGGQGDLLKILNSDNSYVYVNGG